ncbi:hypothetical protein D7D52_37305 [Nocardia yunnanensis]|uniref:Uncharacterized protein n=2 Tax=Nocardia yunnanensis TaxID=2382165 RepID=A0A386ZPR0_9NOCA|nr:hypothetical protein D7D52_37305 [Nocardia yunnanensis]
MANNWIGPLIAAAGLVVLVGCSSTTNSSPTEAKPAGVDQDYQTLSCVAVPEDLRWEYSYLYDARGQLKPLSEIKTMPVDQVRGEDPLNDVTALYKALESRYGHRPACGETYPKGTSGQLNINVLNHKALSCTDIPADLKQKYPSLFDTDGRLKSWKTIASMPANSAGDDPGEDVTSLYNQVVSRLGHPVSCPQN